MHVRWMLCSCIISSVSMTTSISGKTASIECWPLRRFLDRAADLDAVAGRQRARGSVRARRRSAR